MKRKRLFIAPHLDDSAISFGGTLAAAHAQPSSASRTLAATVFSRSNFTKHGPGDAEVVSETRQREERAAMASIGVAVRFLGFPECLLRGYTITGTLDYPKEIRPDLDAGLVDEVAQRLTGLLADFDEVMAPLAVGARAHADHRIVRQAATKAWEKSTRPLFRLYEDVPYIGEENRNHVSGLDGFELETFPIALSAKRALCRRYSSQPIDAWEDLVCAMAGTPPIERTWVVRDPSVLEILE